jgi:hypothetical protein
MRKHRYKVTILLILLVIVLSIAFSGCINSPTYESTTYESTTYGYITTIALGEMKTELIELNDEYDKYEVETNVGTVSYRGYTYQTHRVTLWRGDVKKIVNKVIEYELHTRNPSVRSEPKVFGYVTTITFDKKTELIESDDNYDKYELEENVGTVRYRGYTYQTHRIILWKGDTKRVINNVIEYHLRRSYFY